MGKIQQTYQTQIGIPNKEGLYFAHPAYWPKWNTYKYPSRMALGINLDYQGNKKLRKYQFTFRGMLYAISRRTALKTAYMPSGVSFVYYTHYIPLEAFEMGEITNPDIEWEFGINAEGFEVAYQKGSREPEQLSLL